MLAVLLINNLQATQSGDSLIREPGHAFECHHRADLCVIFYGVCISEKTSLPFHILDHEATASRAVLPLALPRE